MAAVRVVLPSPLRALLQLPDGELRVEVSGTVTLAAVLDALEARHPALRGTIRDHVSKQRRAFVRFYACETDWSHTPHDAPLPDVIATGREPLLIVGAMAGG